MAEAPVLSDEEIERELSGLPGWERVGDEIVRTFRTGRYHGGVALIVHVADIERLIGHHADIDLRWETVKFAITTHDMGNRLTAADFDLARRINEICTAHGAE
ncbi:4a-hydroxytetrahydrobiopterin dehydratase [Actinacidiphila glaucinigra]|uniref:Putative pterin-4-alpha-carbinolamine dehydratase n=1 Tax=Actinacidiphila glaucinigra TaxID=235986 RepID=A0A239LTN5_9ACTN|nr:4a-hydroxytetrahydrobiopterin dehydratase [Actinacidiphila glaucinigra]SNT33238.1 pterin-4-alpha-carbinolamine dehydratase [Actinacidiphila glaucinigra]